MPDASGRFKGISVPALPWHEDTFENINARAKAKLAAVDQEARARLYAALDADAPQEQ